ncbi:hypothetical protein [Halorhodospira halophila]|uniref:Entericidin EcnAB n=1 Tax=Halorhodospira halophila (strain DSM 244 / SL1) TaxID=349124 RepID=A1WXD0_HALHL|nr:hypothetical protein [Halorhodospira halophila]ABM62342.1 conserved hypothetical protein [Halorhodospira halophila SL1]MBK1730057.1 hypothetical protein [Halorhodospira halophila]
MMKYLKAIGIALVMGLFLVALSGCNSGPAEDAGEEVDDAVEEAGDSLEEAGEDAEDAGEDAGY